MGIASCLKFELGNSSYAQLYGCGCGACFLLDLGLEPRPGLGNCHLWLPLLELIHDPSDFWRLTLPPASHVIAANPNKWQNQNALLTELLGFVPQLLLDDIADAATDTVNNAIDGLEVYLRNEWLPKHTSESPSQDELDAEIDSGLLEFQTLLCGHRDMSIDMLETWSMRNVFCVPEGLNIVMPHQKGLDLSTPQGKDVQMQVELDVMRRKIENVRRFQEQLKQAEQVTEHRLERSKARLDRVKTLQELDPKKIEHLPAAYRSLLTTISSLPTTTPPLPMSISSTKKHTESRAEFIDWAVKRLVTSTTAGPSGKLDLLAQNVRQDEEGDDEFMLAGPPSTGAPNTPGVAGERGPGESLASHEASLVDSEESSVLNTSKRRRSSVAGGSKRRRSSMGLSERARAIGGELSTETRQDEAE
ncbi:Mis12 domain-containing protein [Rhizoctonia solani AG-1 IA]|uniref:Mis12 domain-containing protein n=1 Tax=Thanatephorus cucumeris (strain AG1-IA) TaxID=983506 RepID=L8WK01_THACA|nr:Mis12 domain-containing protein [Rhizoctonia solani AG-1 IA]